MSKPKNDGHDQERIDRAKAKRMIRRAKRLIYLRSLDQLCLK